MKRVEYLQKDGTMMVGNQVRYKFLSEEKMTSEIHKAIQEIGVVMYPLKMEIVNERVIEGKINDRGQKAADTSIALIRAVYRLVDSEDDTFIDVEVFGEGADTMDKRLSKAMTSAYKYMQKQTFAIPSGDDPDRIGYDDEEGLTEAQIQVREQEVKNEAEKKRIEEEARKRAELAGTPTGSNGVDSTRGNKTIHYCASCTAKGIKKEISAKEAQESWNLYKQKLCKDCQNVLKKVAQQ